MDKKNENIFMDDAELMERVKNGDEPAFREIVFKYQQTIYNLCLRYVGQKQDAEEVTQDVFINLYRSAENYQPRAKLSTFLYRIAVNLSLNRIRDLKRRNALSFDYLTGALGIDFQSSQFNPEELYEQKEQNAYLWKAIDSLPVKQKAAVLLKRFHDLSYDEIAEVMGCSVSSVESRLHRAKKALYIWMNSNKKHK